MKGNRIFRDIWREIGIFKSVSPLIISSSDPALNLVVIIWYITE